MRIAFQFDIHKALQAIAYLVARLGGVEKVKLLKLLYIADRENFLRHGYPITGDQQYAMPWGPVPSACLDAINGQSWPQPDAAFQYIQVINNSVTLKIDPGTDRLSTDEIQMLDEVFRLHGSKDRWELVGETHRFPEYKDVFVQGTSTPIPYELMLKHSGDDAKYRHDRPVISEATLSRMICPFPHSETDL